MKLILSVAFRNLFRQKSRSIFLGSGIGLGIAVLIVGFAFSKGVSRNTIDKVIESNLFGHLGVYVTEKKGESSRRIIRDKNEMIELIKARLDHVKDVREALHAGVLAIGNGQQRMLTITGIDLSSPYMLNVCKPIKGNFDDFASGEIENPLILEYQRAKALNVNVGDRVRIRTRTLYGQIQTAQLTLVAIFEFEAPVIAGNIQGGLPLNALKTIMGYQPQETTYLNVVMEEMGDINTILTQADMLHQALTPRPICISVTFKHDGYTQNGVVLGLQSDKDSLDLLKQHISVSRGDMDAFAGGRKAMLMGISLAKTLQVEPGMTISFSYHPKFEKEIKHADFEVAAVIDDRKGQFADLAFISHEDFYDTYLNHLPETSESFTVASLLPLDSPLIPLISSSWKRADRTYTNNALWKKRRQMRRMTYHGRILDVVSMKEAAQDLYDMESAINMMSFFGMMIVFSIILVGVLNTVRMNIRERTREIGTVRAVGMQRKHVVRMLVAEAGLLSLIFALFGVITAYITMDLLSLMTFSPVDMSFSAVLDNGHLKFIPNITSIVINVIMIMVVTMATAYFPVRKAAKMSVANALGHYE